MIINKRANSVVIYKNHLTNAIIALIFFLIAFRITIALVVLVPILTLILVYMYGIERKVLIAICWVVSFYILYISIFKFNSLEDIEGRGILRFMLPFIISSMSIMYVFSLRCFNFRLLLFFYAVSSFIYGLSIVIYSLFIGLSGYGDIYDFYYGSYINSPIYALLICFSAIIILDTVKPINYLLAFALISTTFFFCVIYLGARSAFFLLLIYILFRFIESILRASYIIKIKLAIVFLLLSTLLIFYDFSYDLIPSFGGFEQRGFDSPRFALLQYGVSNMMDYPFGGMKTYYAQTSYDGNWFHNVYLDITSNAGYLMAIFFLIIQFYILSKMILIKLAGRKSFTLAFIVFSLAISQDLAFDGHYNFMVYFFILWAYVVRGFDNV